VLLGPDQHVGAVAAAHRDIAFLVLDRDLERLAGVDLDDLFDQFLGSA
jgi:hypothetical protein